MTALPRDPAILLSYINTQLRDFYPSREELCAALSIDGKALDERLSAINYIYDAEQNRYV